MFFNGKWPAKTLFNLLRWTMNPKFNRHIVSATLSLKSDEHIIYDIITVLKNVAEILFFISKINDKILQLC